MVCASMLARVERQTRAEDYRNDRAEQRGREQLLAKPVSDDPADFHLAKAQARVKAAAQLAEKKERQQQHVARLRAEGQYIPDFREPSGLTATRSVRRSSPEPPSRPLGPRRCRNRRSCRSGSERLPGGPSRGPPGRCADGARPSRPGPG